MMKIYSTLFLIVLLAACTPYKMSVSDELKTNGKEYAVKGRQGLMIKQKMSFGQYKTTKVKRSWTRSINKNGIGNGNTNSNFLGLISAEYIDKKQALNFSLTDGTFTSEVFCVSKFNALDVNLGTNANSIFNIGIDLAGFGGSSSNTYYVQIYTNESGGVPWEFLLDNQSSQLNAKTYIGYLARGKDNYYTIKPVTKLEHNGKAGNILAGNVGFEIINKNGVAIAAVNTMSNGIIYLQKTTAEERFLMANLCAAILLQQQIS